MQNEKNVVFIYYDRIVKKKGEKGKRWFYFLKKGIKMNRWLLSSSCSSGSLPKDTSSFNVNRSIERQ